MGHDCSQKRDPCIHSESGISGSAACNVDFGNNKCEPINGTNHYICRCGRSYSADPNLPFDNCKKKELPCASTLCIFGTCRVTEDGNYGACVCNLDYKGPHCDIPRGAWGKWHSWTDCAPQCSSQPQRRRVRDCFGETDDCIGAIEEVEDCAPFECPHEGNPEEVELANMSAMLVNTAKISIIGVLLGLAIMITLSGLSSRKTYVMEAVAIMKAKKHFEKKGAFASEQEDLDRLPSDHGWEWQWDDASKN